jgi:hypothetical protein
MRRIGLAVVLTIALLAAAEARLEQQSCQLGKLARGLRPEHRDSDVFALHVTECAQALI